jgi:hypothetical protein
MASRMDREAICLLVLLSLYSLVVEFDCEVAGGFTLANQQQQ